MRSKGFTLIELLAVIVILAIIALIAVPIILGIIGDSKKEGNKRSIDMYADAIKNAVASYLIQNPDDDEKITLEKIKDYIKYNGSTVECEKTHLNDDGTIYLAECKVNGKDINYRYGEYTGTIYRNSNQIVSIGNSIESPWCIVMSEGVSSCEYNSHIVKTFNTQKECEKEILELANSTDATIQSLVSNAVCELGESISYKTTSSNITQNYYLKHEIVNNIVTESYACIRYDGNKEACVRGGGPSYYGTYDGISSSPVDNVENLNPTENIAIIQSTRDYFINNGGFCYFRDSNSRCVSSSFTLDAYSSGILDAIDGDGRCHLFSDGTSFCFPSYLEI